MDGVLQHSFESGAVGGGGVQKSCAGRGCKSRVTWCWTSHCPSNRKFGLFPLLGRSPDVERHQAHGSKQSPSWGYQNRANLWDYGCDFCRSPKIATFSRPQGVRFSAIRKHLQSLVSSDFSATFKGENDPRCGNSLRCLVFSEKLLANGDARFDAPSLQTLILSLPGLGGGGFSSKRQGMPSAGEP